LTFRWFWCGVLSHWLTSFLQLCESMDTPRPMDYSTLTFLVCIP